MKIKNVAAPTSLKEVAVKLRVGNKRVAVHAISLDSVIIAFEYRHHRVEVVKGDILAALKQMEKIVTKRK